MSILNDLKSRKKWIEFLKYKTEKELLTKKEEKDLKEFIKKRKYKKIAKLIAKEKYIFDYPTKSIISKMNNTKKRVVYSFKKEETYILKFITYMLYKYDNCFSPNCYAFRKNIGVKKAIKYLTKKNNIDNMYGYKIDISNYFNSIDINILLPILKDVMVDDVKLYNLISNILINDKVCYNNNINTESKGVMAGTPISPFLANLYLKEMDEYFYNKKAIYLRYSDDILIFAKDKEKLNEYIEKINDYLEKYNLKINPSKEKYYLPKDKIEFLGFSYQAGIIDLSDNTKDKIKGKIRRSARGIRRWMLKNDANSNRAIKAMNRKFNRKFYQRNTGRDLTWSKWFFPIINTTNGLKEIDLYLQQYLRYIVTGKHNKKNYEKVAYKILKECNYKPLVHEYYEVKQKN